MKYRLLLVVLVLCVAPLALGQTGVVGSVHDLSATGGTPLTQETLQVCVFCHTPHVTSTTAIQTPLWNHTPTTFAGANYGQYSSTTMNHTAGTIAKTVDGSDVAYSSLCMSCHDGTVSVISMYNPPNEGATLVASPPADLTGGIMQAANTANVGTSLANDHPVSFAPVGATITADGGLKALPWNDTGGKDMLIGGNLECGSCHDVHNKNVAASAIALLRVSHDNSAICTTCHDK